MPLRRGRRGVAGERRRPAVLPQESVIRGEHQDGAGGLGQAAIVAEPVVNLREVARRHVVIALVVGL